MKHVADQTDRAWVQTPRDAAGAPDHTSMKPLRTSGGWANSVELVIVQARDDVSSVPNEIKTPGYSLVKLRGSYSWKTVRLDFGVQNLLDKFYYLPTGGAYTGQRTTMTNPALPNCSQWAPPNQAWAARSVSV